MKKVYGSGGRFLGRSINEIKASRRGIVHRQFQDGTAIINLEGGGVVRASGARDRRPLPPEGRPVRAGGPRRERGGRRLAGAHVNL